MSVVQIAPGQLAQTVSPNPKCNGCLHYRSNDGQNGLCSVGLRPWLCGDGDNQASGYSPLAAQKPTEPGDRAESGSAPEVDDVNRVVPITLCVLGEEHAEMVKSVHDALDATQKSFCPFHQSSGVVRSYSGAVGAQRCDCSRISSKEIAKGVYRRLQNNERAHITQEDVVNFVRGIRKGLTPFDVALLRLHEPPSDEINKSLNGQQCGLGDNNALAKSLYGEDWTTQFLGTDLFDDAAKLREQEIAVCEVELKNRIERRKKEKERVAAAPKYEPDFDYDAQYAAEEKLRVAKARLMLKLQRHRQKAMSGNKISKAQKIKNGLTSSHSSAKTKMRVPGHVMAAARHYDKIEHGPSGHGTGTVGQSRAAFKKLGNAAAKHVNSLGLDAAGHARAAAQHRTQAGRHFDTTRGDAHNQMAMAHTKAARAVGKVKK